MNFIFLLVSIAWINVIQVITHALTMLRNDDNRLQPREYGSIDKCSGHSYMDIQPLYSTLLPEHIMMTSSNGNIFRVTGHLCGEFTGLRWIPAQRPVTQSFDVFFDLRLNKQVSKQSRGWWFETLACPLWHQCNVELWHCQYNTQAS